jgi:hypothetical protein
MYGIARNASDLTGIHPPVPGTYADEMRRRIRPQDQTLAARSSPSRGAARPAPLVLGLALVLLLAIPLGFAMTHRLASGDDAPVG